VACAREAGNSLAAASESVCSAVKESEHGSGDKEHNWRREAVRHGVNGPNSGLAVCVKGEAE
jgi:hypothetical protein